MNQLPKGGVQQTTAPLPQTPPAGRAVNRARLEKMSDDMLTRKIGSLKSKVARKDEAAQKKIAAIKQKVNEYRIYKEEEASVAKQILESRGRKTPLPATPKDKAA